MPPVHLAPSQSGPSDQSSAPHLCRETDGALPPCMDPWMEEKQGLGGGVERGAHFSWGTTEAPPNRRLTLWDPGRDTHFLFILKQYQSLFDIVQK